MSMIEARNVSRSFVIPHVRRNSPLGRIESFLRGRDSSADEVYNAVRDVSFAVERGEIVGILGRNGSGKSTLLKIIANILRPTAGSVRVNGTISPLLELGMSFHKELTAEENIYLYGGYLGMSRAWTVGRLERILEFAELERFRDAKLHSFSTGMRSRLAFSVAIQVEPDILLLDEVFAVGDFLFKQKCLAEMERFKENGTTILFVSHDMGAVHRFCDRALVMEQGALVFDGEIEQAVEQYIYRSGEQKQAKAAAGQPAARPAAQAPDKAGQPAKRWGDGRVRIEAVRLLDKHGQTSTTVRSGDALRVRISYSAAEKIADPVFGISIQNQRKVRIYGTNSKNLKQRIEFVQGSGSVDFVFERFPLAEGQYQLTVAAHDYTDSSLVYDRIERALDFNVANPFDFAGEVDLNARFEAVADV